MKRLSDKSPDRCHLLKWWVIRIVETFAIFVTFAVYKEWADCWRTTQDVGHARNKWLYALRSILLAVTSVTLSGTRHKSQNYVMHQSCRWCFNRRTASLGDWVIASVLATGIQYTTTFWSPWNALTLNSILTSTEMSVVHLKWQKNGGQKNRAMSPQVFHFFAHHFFATLSLISSCVSCNEAIKR